MEKVSVIIALGGGLEHRTTADPPRAWIGQQTKLRAEAAATLWNKHPESLLVFSGGRSSKDSPSEAEAMKDYVCQSPWNIPADSVLTENDSIDTAGNIRNTIALLRARGISLDSVTLVTGRRHRRRAVQYCRAHGISLTAKAACEVLGTKPEYVSMKDYMHEIMLTFLQLFDRTGQVPTWIKYSQKRREEA